MSTISGTNATRSSITRTIFHNILILNIEIKNKVSSNTQVIVHLTKQFGNTVVLLILLSKNRGHIPNDHFPRVLTCQSTLKILAPNNKWSVSELGWNKNDLPQTKLNLKLYYSQEKNDRRRDVRGCRCSPWPPVANLVPSGWISTENIGLAENKHTQHKYRLKTHL